MIIKSPYVLFYEITSGPFNRKKDTIFSNWSASEDKYPSYYLDLKKSVRKFLQKK
jgi:hypothetical protein